MEKTSQFLHPFIRSERGLLPVLVQNNWNWPKAGAGCAYFTFPQPKATRCSKNRSPTRKSPPRCASTTFGFPIRLCHKGQQNKMEPCGKTAKDRDGLWKALLDDRIDVIATDHAPHTLEGKATRLYQGSFWRALSATSLVALLKCIIEKNTFGKNRREVCTQSRPLVRKSRTGAICGKATKPIWYWWTSMPLDREQGKHPVQMRLVAF